ncbi:MAG: hypothetical protein M1837_006690 [Sclerophora amabilis]|nr:MAG: hypothetical protein M1837_006690 [Sclerophora amabilis]
MSQTSSRGRATPVGSVELDWNLLELPGELHQPRESKDFKLYTTLQFNRSRTGTKYQRGAEPCPKTNLTVAFSISHDHQAVGIYGHYTLVNGDETSFYRHLIRDFGIPNQEGKDKWTAYKFSRNVYDTFAPIHAERICAAVDELPDPEVFLVEALSQQSDADFVGQDDSQSTLSYSQESAQKPPSSQTTEPVFKKPKGKGTRK